MSIDMGAGDTTALFNVQLEQTLLKVFTGIVQMHSYDDCPAPVCVIEPMKNADVIQLAVIRDEDSVLQRKLDAEEKIIANLSEVFIEASIETTLNENGLTISLTRENADRLFALHTRLKEEAAFRITP